MESTFLKMYPERASNGVETKVEALKNILSGETPVWEVTAVERAEILSIESDLALKLEPIYLIKTPGVNFDTAYLLTSDGQVDFFEVTGMTIPDGVVDTKEIENFLYNNADRLATVDSRALLELSGRTKKFRKDVIFKALDSTMEESGEIDIRVLPISSELTIQLNPDLDYSKDEQLRELKVEIKDKREKLRGSEVSDGYRQFLDGVYELYQRKINELLALRAGVVQNIKNKAEHTGEDSLPAVEQRLLQEEAFLNNRSVRDLSRYDKFLHGADELNDLGWRGQVPSDLLAYAEQKERENIAILKNKESEVHDRGLDSKKIFDKTIPIEAVEKICIDTLAHYDLLSAEPASAYMPDRSGPAADNKWQVIVSDAYPNPSVNSTQKVLKCPNLPQSLDRLLTVFVAHEIEGHVLQYNNRGEIPLSFFDKIGSDRSSIFVEAGAMDNQDTVAREAFGYTSSSVPQYIKAMVTKLEGGSYADCVDAYYRSTIKGYQELLIEGQIDQKMFAKECRKRLRVAISSASRLFSGSLSSSDTSGHLINSKDTVYLEQTLLVDALNKAGFSDILNLAGVNFSTLEFLLKAQLIDLNAIKKPDFYALKLWDQMKDDYRLKIETD